MQTGDIQSFVLRDGDVALTLLSIGCVVQSWTVAGVPVVLGYADAEDYRKNPVAMGMVVGRVINRIGNAQFQLQGHSYSLPANCGPHHIHGGPGGLGWRIWQAEQLDARSVRFEIVSEHLDQGYPGQIAFAVTMRLDGYSLIYEMHGLPDRLTPINMAQHLYFNLNGQGDIRAHALRVAASHYTPTDASARPLGRVDTVAKTRYDFRQTQTIASADPDGLGHDASLVLDAHSFDDPVLQLQADSGLRLRMWSDQSCVQLYTSGTLDAHAPAGPGAAHQRFSGVCLEAQNYPDALSYPNFPSILHSPDNPYRQRLRIEIAPS